MSDFNFLKITYGDLARHFNLNKNVYVTHSCSWVGLGNLYHSLNWLAASQSCNTHSDSLNENPNVLS